MSEPENRSALIDPFGGIGEGMFDEEIGEDSEEEIETVTFRLKERVSFKLKKDKTSFKIRGGRC